MESLVELEILEEDRDDIEENHTEMYMTEDENSGNSVQGTCVESAARQKGLQEGCTVEDCISEETTIERGMIPEIWLRTFIEPTVGMEFETHIAAGKFYNNYAKQAGFATKIRQSRSNHINGKWYVQFSCNKEGFRRVKTSRSLNTMWHRPDVRCGCLATMKIKLIERSRWKVFYINLVHNHAVSPRQIEDHEHLELLVEHNENEHLESPRHSQHLEEDPFDSGRETVNNRPTDNSKPTEAECNEVAFVEPAEGMEFESYTAAGKFYSSYAKQVGFETKIRQSRSNMKHGKRYVQFSCNKEGYKRAKSSRTLITRRDRPDVRCGCLATMKIKLIRHDKWRVFHVNLVHNHSVGQTKSRHSKPSKQLDNGAKKRSQLHEQCIWKENGTFRLSANDGKGQGQIILNEETEGLSFTEASIWMRLDKEDSEAMHLFFTQMKAKSSSFFYSMDHDDDGHLRNIFWVDARSRASYEHFGDVVKFDIMNLPDKNNLKFALFVGVNHHGQPIVLGCGLLSSARKESLIWLFQKWLMAMSGHPPNAIISNLSDAIQGAVDEAFPQAHCCLCLCHIMQQIPQKLGALAKYKEIKRKIKSIVYDSLRAHEFEQEWHEMIMTYNLKTNKWLNMLYKLKEKWVPAYLKDAFWAGMCSVWRIERVDISFASCFHSVRCLKEFFEQYETILNASYEKEAAADFSNLNSQPILKQPHWFEAQLVNIYTISIFKRFQREISGMLHCYDMSSTNDNDMVTSYALKERIMDKAGQWSLTRQYEVICNKTKMEVTCLCGLFQFKGLLCRHTLYILQNLGVVKIPSRYIMVRWRKDCMSSQYGQSTTDMLMNSFSQRSDLLLHKFSTFFEGALSKEGYMVALQVLEEAWQKMQPVNSQTTKDQGETMTPSLTVSNAHGDTLKHCITMLDSNMKSHELTENGLMKDLNKRKKLATYDNSKQQISSNALSIRDPNSVRKLVVTPNRQQHT